MVLSLAPSVFAAEGDGPKIITSVDKDSVKPGETITVTYTLSEQLSPVNNITIALDYDKTAFEYKSVDYTNSVFFKAPTTANYKAYGVFCMLEWGDDGSGEGIIVPAGELCKVTLVALENITDAQAGSLYNYQSSAYDMTSLLMVDWEEYDTTNGGFDHGDSDPIRVNIIPDGSSITVPKTDTNYSVSMGADQTVANGETVSIPVTVASSEKRITGFNAYDMTFTYDPAALTLNTASDAAANLTVEDDNNGTVRVRRYGDAVPLGEALALEFTAKATATSTVTLTSAKFDLDANSINFDAPDATITDAATVVNANNFTVTLPDDFTSDAETRLVLAGGSFTFKPVDSHYDYVFTVKVGDTVTEGQTFGEGGTYTVSDVNANVEVTVTSKTPKQYDVTYKYTRDNVTVDTMDEVIVGPAKATYNEDYSFSIRPRDDTSYSVRAIWGMSTDTQTTLRGTANPDGTITYTLDKYYVKKDFRICIDATSGNKFNVVFNGNGAEDVDPGAPSSVGANNPYYFKLNKRENCDYTVTAVFKPNRYDGSQNIHGIVTETSNGQYMITTVNGVGGGNATSWTLEITITKVSHNAEEVDVTTYLNLDGKTMMLVTVKGTPENGSAFTYDGNTMYKVEGYGTDWYAWLVILEKDQTLTKEDAAAKVAVSAADNVVTIANGYDVNMTGVVDINDAQLVYDIYNGTYGDFGKVSMEKFLRADVNASKNVDSADAVAIVSQFR